jgi:hypothetical protein
MRRLNSKCRQIAARGKCNIFALKSNPAMQYLAGIILSFFLFFLLVLKKEKTAADIVLMIWMAVIAVHQLLFYFDFKELSFQYPHLLGVGIPIPLLHGVLLFFYVSALTKGRFPGWKRHCRTLCRSCC